jgi:hypothetical protein
MFGQSKFNHSPDEDVKGRFNRDNEKILDRDGQKNS